MHTWVNIITKNRKNLEENACVLEIRIRSQEAPGEYGREVLGHVVEVSNEAVLVAQHATLRLQHRPHSRRQRLHGNTYRTRSPPTDVTLATNNEHQQLLTKHQQLITNTSNS